MMNKQHVCSKMLLLCHTDAESRDMWPAVEASQLHVTLPAKLHINHSKPGPGWNGAFVWHFVLIQLIGVHNGVTDDGFFHWEFSSHISWISKSIKSCSDNRLIKVMGYTYTLRNTVPRWRCSSFFLKKEKTMILWHTSENISFWLCRSPKYFASLQFSSVSFLLLH